MKTERVTDRRPTIEPSRRVRQSAALLAAFFLASCGGSASQVVPTSFQGFVVADEPRAAMVGREILSQGGNAADAAVATALAMAVTLPSRAGLGGGGACVARNGREPTPTGGLIIGGTRSPQQQEVTTRRFAFLPVAAGPGSGTALPMLARGLAAVHAQYGSLRWERVIAPAENLARFGVPVSRALIRDIATSGIEVSGADGRPLREGENLQQPELAQSLAALRTRGPGDLYGGALADAFADGLGGAVDRRLLADAAPTAELAKGVEYGNDLYYFTPSPGGVLAAALLRTATNDRGAGARDAAQRAQVRLEAAAKSPHVAAAPSAEGAATGLVAVDERGGAVACSFTMGRLFGTRRYASGTGILAGAPAAPGTPEGQAVVALLIGNENANQLLGAFAAGGDASAPAALVQTVLETMAADQPLDRAVAAPRLYPAGGTVYAEKGAVVPAKGGTAQATDLPLGRVNAVLCRGGLPKSADSCLAATDPRGFGVAAAADLVR